MNNEAGRLLYHKVYGALYSNKVINASKHKVRPDYEFFLREMSQYTNPIPLTVTQSFPVQSTNGEMMVVILDSIKDAQIQDPTGEIILITRVNQKYVFYWQDKYWMEAIVTESGNDIFHNAETTRRSAHFPNNFERFANNSIIIIYEVKNDERNRNDGTYDWLEADTT